MTPAAAPLEPATEPKRRSKPLKRALLALIVVTVLLPILALTPFGIRRIHSWGVNSASPRMLSIATGLRSLTGSPETAADTLRESFLLFPDDPRADARLQRAAEIYYALGTTAERSEQQRLYAKARAVYTRLSGRTQARSQPDQATVKNRLDTLDQFSRYSSDPFTDAWDPTKLKDRKR